MLLVKAVPFVVSLLISFILFIPASWADFILMRFSGDALGLVNSDGTIWSGSGDLILRPSKIFSYSSREILNERNSKDFIFIAKKINWKILPNKLNENDFGLTFKLMHHSINWKENSSIKIAKNFFDIPTGEVKLKKLNLSEANGILGFFKPQFELNIKWDQILFSRGVIVNEPFVIQIYLNNLETSLSPIKPLGSYKIVLTKDNSYLKWFLESIEGSSIAFTARGDYLKFPRGNGEFTCLKHCEYMTSLLSAVGKKQGDNVYGFAFGN